MPRTLRRSARLAAWRADAVLVLLVLAAALIAAHVAFRVLLPDTDPEGGDGGTERGSTGHLELGPTELSPLQMTLEGRVAGLYPGAVVDLPVEVRNPAQAEIMVTSLAVEVGEPGPRSAPEVAGACGPDSLTVGSSAAPGGGDVAVRVPVPIGGSATIAVPVALRADAPSACQGVSFPLTYRAEGYLP